MVNSINFLKYLDKYYQINQEEYSYNKILFIIVPLVLSFLTYLFIDFFLIKSFFKELITFFAILISLSISILVYIINVNNLNFLGEDKKAKKRKDLVVQFKKKFSLGLFTLIFWGTILILGFSVYVNLSFYNLEYLEYYFISILSIFLLFLFFHILIIIFNVYRLLAHLIDANFKLEEEFSKNKK